MQTVAQIRAKAELELRKRRAGRLKDYSNQIEYYSTHPLDYFVERLRIKRETIDWLLIPEYANHRWDGTVNPLMKILNSLVNNKWCGVESGTGTGKTYLGALIVLWFLECFSNSMVVTTAPKQDQLSLFIWKEISKLFPTFNRGELISLKLRMNPGSDDWVAVGFVAGVKANEESSTKAQGFHAEHMLIIFEETPGVPQPTITAFQNTCTAPHNLILAFGNPDYQLDNLHRFCKLPNVEHVRMSGFDHPNVVLNNPRFIPGAQSREGLEKLLARYGDELNPLYMSRARGISPAQSKDSLILLEWCYEAAEKRKQFEDDNGKIKPELLKGKRGLGVDVANSDNGDKAAIAEGVGNVLLKVDDFICPDSNQLGRIVYQQMNDKDIMPSMIGVDGVGVGAGTVNTLKELGQSVVNIQGAETPHDLGTEEVFNNLRSQMYWQMREDLRLGNLLLPPDEDLFADLSTPKWFTRNGKICVESKEEIKIRLGHSPNKGDAAVYFNWIRNIGGYELNVTTRRVRMSSKLTEGF